MNGRAGYKSEGGRESVLLHIHSQRMTRMSRPWLLHISDSISAFDAEKPSMFMDVIVSAGLLKLKDSWDWLLLVVLRWSKD